MTNKKTSKKKKPGTIKFEASPKEVSTEELAARGILARDVFERMYKATESFELRGVGVSTAYLMGAILVPRPGNKALFWLNVAEPLDVMYMHLCRTVFLPTSTGAHPVWDYFELISPEEGTLPTEAMACIVAKQHFSEKDPKGFCVKCGHPEGQGWVDALGFADMGLADPNYKPRNVRRLPRKGTQA